MTNFLHECDDTIWMTRTRTVGFLVAADLRPKAQFSPERAQEGGNYGTKGPGVPERVTPRGVAVNCAPA